MTVNRFVRQPRFHLIVRPAAQTEFMNLRDVGHQPPRHTGPAGLLGAISEFSGPFPARAPRSTWPKGPAGISKIHSTALGTCPGGSATGAPPQEAGGSGQTAEFMTATEAITGRERAQKGALFPVPKIGARKRTRFLTQRAGTHSGCPRVASVFGAIFGSWKRGRVSKPTRHPIWMFIADRKRCHGGPRGQLQL